MPPIVARIGESCRPIYRRRVYGNGGNHDRHLPLEAEARQLKEQGKSLRGLAGGRDYINLEPLVTFVVQN